MLYNVWDSKWLHLNYLSLISYPLDIYELDALQQSFVFLLIIFVELVMQSFVEQPTGLIIVCSLS